MRHVILRNPIFILDLSNTDYKREPGALPVLTVRPSAPGSLARRLRFRRSTRPRGISRRAVPDIDLWLYYPRESF